jgi:hypothetical protein
MCGAIDTVINRHSRLIASVHFAVSFPRRPAKRAGVPLTDSVPSATQRSRIAGEAMTVEPASTQLQIYISHRAEFT